MLLGLYTKVQSALAGLLDRLRREEGAVATEYILLLVLIAFAIIAAAGALGLALSTKFNAAATYLNGITNP